MTKTHTTDDRARAALPLTPIALHILLALVDRARHGLGIAQHVEQFTDGRLSLGPGNLYGTIKKLLETGLIGEADAGHLNHAGDAADPRRRYYTISPVGRRALELETRDLANVLNVARMKKVLR